MSGRICMLPGCGKPHHAHGYCCSHANRFAKHGDPLGGGTSKGATLRWIEDVLANANQAECWEWPFARSPLGYGVIMYRKRREFAHRVVKMLSGSEVGPDDTVCHHCDNPPCVNPSHTYVGTMATNAADRSARGRWRGPMILTAGQANEIRRRRAAGERGKDLAAEFGVSPALICDIHKGRSRVA